MMNRVLLIVLIALAAIWATVDVYQRTETGRIAKRQIQATYHSAPTHSGLGH